MGIKRLVDTTVESDTSEDEKIEATIRPQTFDDYIGQEQLKRNLKLAITAAKKRQEPVDHILLYGPPGLGKTTMATVIANEMGHHIKITAGSAIARAGDLASMLTNLERRVTFFLLMKFIAYLARLKRCYTRQWKILNLIL